MVLNGGKGAIFCVLGASSATAGISVAKAFGGFISGLVVRWFFLSVIPWTGCSVSITQRSLTEAYSPGDGRNGGSLLCRRCSVNTSDDRLRIILLRRVGLSKISNN